MGRHRAVAAVVCLLCLLSARRAVLAGPGVVSGAYWTVTVADDLTVLAVTDLDGDGWSEILGGTDEGLVIAWTAGGRPLWEFEVDSDWVTGLDSADLDEDGLAEILVTAGGILPTSYLHVLSADGSLRWSHAVREDLWAALPFNVDNDPDLELLLAARRPGFLDANGLEIPGNPTQRPNTPHVREVDFDGDGQQELAAVKPGTLTILEANGLSSTVPLDLAGEIKAIEFGDLEGDGSIELTALTEAGLALLENDGALRWTWPLHGEPGGIDLMSSSGSREGQLQIIFSDASGIVALDPTGRQRWAFDAGLPVGRPFVVTGHESSILAGTAEGQAYLLNADGQRLAEYDLGAPITETRIADLNGDGELELLLVSGGTLSVFGTPTEGGEIRTRWRYAAGAPIVMLAANDVDRDGRAEVFLGERDGRATLLNRNGNPVWQHAHENQQIGLAADGTGRFLMWAGGGIHRHDNQGSILWEAPITGTIRNAVPALGEIAVMTDDGRVALHALDDGRHLWTAELSRVGADLAGSSENVVHLSQDGTVTLLGDDGRTLWETVLPRSGEAIAFTPNGGVLVLSRDHLYWLEDHGDSLWDWSAQAAERVTAVAPGESLLGVGTDARVIALDNQGDEVWSQLSDEVISAVAIIDVDAEGGEETVVGTVNGSVLLFSSVGEEMWRAIGRERVNALATGDVNGDGFPEILAGFEDGAVIAYGIMLDQPPWLGAPAVTAVGDAYQYAARVHDPDGDPVRVTLEVWDPSAEIWKPLGSTTASSGEGTLTWNVPKPFDTWDAGRDSAFRFNWDDGRRARTTAAFPGPLHIPVDPWYLTYGRIIALAALITSVPTLLLIIVRRTRTHRRSPLGQAEVALFRLFLDPDEAMHELHRLLSDETRALTLLEHMPGLARDAGEAIHGDLLEGAYLALTRPEVMAEALKTITSALQGLAALPLAQETRQLLVLLLEALSIKTVSEAAGMRRQLDVSATDLEVGDSHLAPLAEALVRLGGVARTLRASQHVEGTSDRIAYLAAAIADLGELKRRIDSDLSGLEHKTVAVVLDHWLSFVTDALERLRGRAEIDLALVTRQLVLRDEMTLRVKVTNTGRSPATDLAVELLPGEALNPGPGQAMVEVLSPGASAQLEVVGRSTGSIGFFEITLQLTWADREWAGKQTRFAERVRVLPAPREFLPIPNPYATGRPLGPGSPLFVGRTELLDFLNDKLADDHIVILVGERRMGKTSLLQQLPNRLGGGWTVAYLDGQSLGLEGNLAHWLADAALEIARATDSSVRCPSVSDLSDRPGPTFESFLQHSLDALPEDHRLLVLLDEYEEIEAKVRDGDLPPGIFPYLRHLMQFGEAGFLLAGTQRLERLSPVYWTPLFNIGVYCEMGPLDEAASRLLISEPVADRLLYDDFAVDKLLRLSGCQPYFLQLLCHCVVSDCNREKRAYITASEIDPSVQEAMMLGQAHLRFLWDGVSSGGQATLLALARLIADGEPGTIEAIAAELVLREQEGEDFSLVETLMYLENLGLLSHSADGRYRFAADIVRLWIEERGFPL